MNNIDSLNYLGTFATIDEVYAVYPSGGVPGNFVIVDGVALYWNEHTMRWAPKDGGASGDTTVNGTLTADEVVLKDGFRTSDYREDTKGSALRKRNGQWVLSVDDIRLRNGGSFRGQSSFTSFVFRRCATQPAAPQGGKFDDPTPDGTLWHDGIPQGTEPIWMSSRVFTDDQQPPQQSVWATPRKLTDDDTMEFLLSNARTDYVPDDPSDENRGTLWFDPSTDSEQWSTMNWMAFATKSYDANGNVNYGAWTKVPIKGERGADGPGFENVFYRTTKFIQPVPIIAAGTAFQMDDYKPGVANKASCGGEGRIFTDNPKGVTEEWKYEWMMTRKKKNGVWQNFVNSGIVNNPVLFATFSKEHDVYISNGGTWVIDGVDTGVRAAGEGVSPEGRVDYYEESDIPAGESGKTSLEGITTDASVEKTVGKCWIVDESGYIYLYLGGESEDWEDHWKELGEFKGEKGEDGVSTYMYIAWAEDVTFTDDDPPAVDNVVNFTTDPVAGQGYGWLGLLVSHTEIADLPANKKFFKWNYLKGRDGMDFEHVYLRTKIFTAPAISEDPVSTPGFQDNDHCPALDNSNNDFITSGRNKNVEYTTFTDDPKGVTEEWPYEWQARRERADGMWQAFQAHAILHNNWAKDGAGQAYIEAVPDKIVVDCHSDGKVKANVSKTINVVLRWGDEDCTITSISVSCNAGTVTVPQVTGDTELDIPYSVAQNTVLSSGAIQVTLEGTDSSNKTHSASLTIPVQASWQGAKGAKGDTGAVLRFRGEWNQNVTYEYNSNFRDCVKHEGVYYMLSAVGQSQNEEPGTQDNNAWESLGPSMKFFATELLLAENAAIEMMSTNKIIFTDADGNKTAGINEDGQGSYKTYYPDTGNLRKDDNADGWTYYYNNVPNTLAWMLGPGGVIIKTGAVIKMQRIRFSESAVGETPTYNPNLNLSIADRWVYSNENSQHNGEVYSDDTLDANNEPNQNKIIADGTYAEWNTWRHRYNKEDDIYEYYLPLVKILNHKVNNKWDAVYVDPNDPLNA